MRECNNALDATTKAIWRDLMINIHKQIICDNCDKTEGEIWTFRLKYKKFHVCWDCLNELSDAANTGILKELKEREKKKEDANE